MRIKSMEESEQLRIRANTLDVMASAPAPDDAGKVSVQAEQARRIETAQTAAQSPAPPAEDDEDDEEQVRRDYGKLFAHYGTNKEHWQGIDRAVAVRHARRLIKRGLQPNQIKSQLRNVLQKYSPAAIEMPNIDQYVKRTANQAVQSPEIKKEQLQEQSQRNTRSILMDTTSPQQAGDKRSEANAVEPRTTRAQQVYTRMYEQANQEMQKRGKELTPEKADHIVAWKLYSQGQSDNDVRDILRQSPHVKSTEQGEAYVSRTMDNVKQEVETIRAQRRHAEMIRMQQMQQSHGMEM